MQSPDALRLAYFATEYPAASHTFILREVLALRALGVEVSTATLNEPRDVPLLDEEEQREAESTHCLKRHLPRAILEHLALFSRAPLRYSRMAGMALARMARVPRAASKTFAYFIGAGRLWHWLARQGLSHVHVHFGNAGAAIAELASHGGAIGYSVSIHGPYEFEASQRILLDRILQRAAFVRTISRKGQRACRARLPGAESKVELIPCGVARRPLPEGRIPAPDAFRWLAVGRLVEEKGHRSLLESLALLGKSPTRHTLTVVGDGPLRASLVESARRLGVEDRVRFVGVGSRSQVETLLDQADGFVHGGLREGLPVVLMEAFAHALPTVAAAVDGVPDLLRDQVNGVAARAGDALSIAEGMARVAADPGLARALGIAAHATVAQRFSLEDSAKALEAVHRGVGPGNRGVAGTRGATLAPKPA